MNFIRVFDTMFAVEKITSIEYNENTGELVVMVGRHDSTATWHNVTRPQFEALIQELSTRNGPLCT